MEFVRPKKPALSVDMAPLIDVVFQLLIFFMLSSSFLSPAMKLALPKAVTQDRADSEKIVVSISKEGELFVNDARVSMERLPAAIEERLGGDSKKAVHIKGDKDMPYRFFVEAMDAARQAGAKQVNVMHETGRAT